MGAWIETTQKTLSSTACKSHPTWVRGLKHEQHQPDSRTDKSHPTWVRGLKPSIGLDFEELIGVAPHVGAWIETEIAAVSKVHTPVAPHVGAWIETL